ncbi:IS66 family transposase [Duganella sp. BJB488]|uniref:IS66 family transposase n=1 Tax=unclassified Duganella TaxID=2636909 RepID=UPI000E347589|nr:MULTISPECIES: IS66 family transposase [unclassified Duganella]RFP09119.1 IS66 family transposase [Duganella sp. BJB489]RFP12550.1 IS66 family transposase [Duganella sp. BJB488]RFP29117.1 IS66 family transposase [Duganella sp. BJB480]
MHVDGYAGYNGLDGTVRVGCMAHVRRKFAEVIKLLPVGITGSPTQIANDLIGKLYEVERRIKGLDHHVRHKVRTEESVPILQKLKGWLDKTYPTVAPKSALGRAMSYALDQWTEVSRLVEDGRLSIDNNIAERDIKSVAIGRKNWMFADSMEGMRASATMYSLVATAKANGLNPFEYLRYVFETMPKLKTADEPESLLPWNMPR